MTTEALGYINTCLEGLNIPYEFGEWTSDVPDTFWTGDYTEIEQESEDGYEESTFILTGNTKKSKLELESVKTKLKEYFGNEGRTAILASGAGIAVFYAVSNPIPSVEESVHRLEITLRVKEWRI
ncbi:MAG: hypothetical protein Q4F03_04910 [Eubacteriales bacterium]|nr:hypothetical protein [Eubacteriales bacterium]